MVFGPGLQLSVGDAGIPGRGRGRWRVFGSCGESTKIHRTTIPHLYLNVKYKKQNGKYYTIPARICPFLRRREIGNVPIANFCFPLAASKSDERLLVEETPLDLAQYDFLAYGSTSR